MRKLGFTILILLCFKPLIGLILRGKKETALGLIRGMRQNAQKHMKLDKLDASVSSDGENLFEDVMSKLSKITRRAR